MFSLMDNFFKQESVDYGDKVEIWFIFDSLEEIFESQLVIDPEDDDGDEDSGLLESEKLIVELSSLLMEQKSMIEEGEGWGYEELEVIFYTLA